MKGAEDYEWITRALGQGFYVDNLREQLYYYRAHPQQLSRLVKASRAKKPWEYVLEVDQLNKIKQEGCLPVIFSILAFSELFFATLTMRAASRLYSS